MNSFAPALSALLLLCFLSAAISSENPGIYQDPDFSFSIPDGWQKIPDSQIKSYNTNKPSAFRFQGGIVNEAVASPKTYMLLQNKRNEPETTSRILIYQKTSIPADPISVIADVIEKKQYLSKSEFYSTKYDCFLTISVNRDKITVIVKKYSDTGHVLMHFYLGNNPRNDLQQMETVLVSFNFTRPLRINNTAPLPSD